MKCKSLNRLGRTIKNRSVQLAAIALGALPALAQTNDFDQMTTVVSGASTLFTAVAGLAVTVLTFYVGYKFVKKIK